MDDAHLRPSEAVALFRYRLIAPLLDPLTSDDEKAAWRRRLTQQPQSWPDGPPRPIGERTLRRWVAAYRAGGFHSLATGTRKDKHMLRSVSDALLARTVALKQEDPRRSIPHILRMLATEGFTPEELPHPGTLWRHLSRQGLGSRRRPDKERLRRFERPAPHDLWQSDAMHGPFLPDPHNPEKKRRTYLIAFLDDHSRFMCHAAFYFAEDVYALELCFQQALLRRGVPRRVYVDQGLIFQSQVFTLACAELGIRHLSASPYHPEGKGKVERFFETLQADFLVELHHQPVSTLADLNTRLWAWIEEVYHLRVHSGTGQTPLARLLAGEEPQWVSPERLAEVFLWRTERKADKTGVVSFEGNRYQAPAGTERKRLQLRYHPLHLERLYLYEGDRCVDTLMPLDLTRKRHEKVAEAHVSDSTPSSYLEALVLRQRERQAQVLTPLRLAVAESGRENGKETTS